MTNHNCETVHAKLGGNLILIVLYVFIPLFYALICNVLYIYKNKNHKYWPKIYARAHSYDRNIDIHRGRVSPNYLGTLCYFWLDNSHTSILIGLKILESRVKSDHINYSLLWGHLTIGLYMIVLYSYIFECTAHL